MKRFLFFLVVGILWHFTLPGCFEDDTNPCRSMHENIGLWSRAYCEHKTMDKVDEDIKNNCCDCWCLLASLMVDPLSQQCGCIDPTDTSGQPCEGTALDQADECLSDLEACKMRYVIEPYESVCFASL